MSMTPRMRLEREQGMALIAVMLLLMAMSALAAALAISSATETMIAANHQSAAQARAAAEAGLTHAVDMTLDYLSGWQDDFESVELALDELLANPTMWIDGFDEVQAGITLAGTGTTFSSIAYSGGSFTSIMYEAMLVDDDAANLRDLVLTPDDMTRMGENDDPLDDNNKKIVVRAIGYAGGNAVAAVEATISAWEMPGLLTDGDLTLAGNFTLTGDQGSAHTNGDFSHKGGSWSTSQGCTSTGASDDDGCSSGKPVIPVPDKSAEDYLPLANYILHDDGEMTTISSGTKASCGGTCVGGWTFSSGTWTLGATLTSDEDESAFYVEGHVALSASNYVTVFATGSITAGNGTWQPSVPTLLMVMDGDMRDNGNPNLGTAMNPGLIVIGEQIDLAGNVTIHGAVIVRDATNNDSTVTSNELTGSVVIEYGGEADGNFFAVSAWRRSY